MICSPEKYAKSVAKAKNGPNGIWLARLFFFVTIPIKPTIDPIKELRKITNTNCCQPSKAPKAEMNLISPPPIPIRPRNR